MAIQKQCKKCGNNGNKLNHVGVCVLCEQRWHLKGGAIVDFDGDQLWYGTPILMNPMSVFTHDFVVRIIAQLAHEAIAAHRLAMSSIHGAA